MGHALKAFDNSLYFIVDGVSCIGAVDVDLTKDKIDVLVSEVKSYHATTRSSICCL